MIAAVYFSPEASYLLSPAVFLGIFCGILLAIELGYYYGKRHYKGESSAITGLAGAFDAPILTLLGLLIGFTFFGAAERFERRRNYIIEETNNLGTAYLRLDMLLSADRDSLRSMFKNYLDCRIATYSALPDFERALVEYNRSVALQKKIWSASLEAIQRTGTPYASMHLIPALNAVFDTSTTRLAITKFHPPKIIFILMGWLAFVAAILAGYQMAGANRRSWLHITIFSITLTLAIYVIIDLEYPRSGVIRLESADEVLQDLRKGWGF